jgi:hypothetical protein
MPAGSRANSDTCAARTISPGEANETPRIYWAYRRCGHCLLGAACCASSTDGKNSRPSLNSSSTSRRRRRLGWRFRRPSSRARRRWKTANESMHRIATRLFCVRGGTATLKRLSDDVCRTVSQVARFKVHAVDCGRWTAAPQNLHEEAGPNFPRPRTAAR